MIPPTFWEVRFQVPHDWILGGSARAILKKDDKRDDKKK
jgi:hypothetical protein